MIPKLFGLMGKLRFGNYTVVFGEYRSKSKSMIRKLDCFGNYNDMETKIPKPHPTNECYDSHTPHRK